MSSVQELRDLLASSLLPQDELEAWKDVAADVVDQAAFYRVRKQFETAWSNMLIAAVVGTLGIVAFVWGANPPKSEAPEHPAEIILVVVSAPAGPGQPSSF